MNILLINDFRECGGAEAVYNEQYDILQQDFHVERFYAFNNLTDRKITPFSYIYSFRFKQRLSRLLKKQSFDVIIVHNYSSALSPSILDALAQYKKTHQCKIIYYAHDFHLLSPNRGYCYYKNDRIVNFNVPPSIRYIFFKRIDSRGWLYSLLKKIQWIYAYTLGKKHKVFDLVLAPSDFLVGQILLRYPDMKVERMYNVCKSLTSIDPANRPPKEISSKIRLVYFGRLDPIKGLPNLIKTLCYLKRDYSLTIIGEGDDLPVIQACIEEYRMQRKVFLKPKLSQADLFAELQHYDVFILPSLIYENAPLSIIEAAALGLGLYVANHGGIYEMGKLCNAGFFFNPFDPSDINANLMVLYECFLLDMLPKADFEQLKKLFSRETYIQNLYKYLRDEA